MQTHRFIAPFSAALLAGALAACPAIAQTSGPNPSTKAATKSENPSGQAPSAVKIDHGPGVIDHDTAEARAHMYGTTPATGPVAASSYFGEPAAYAYGPNYGGYGYAYEGGPDNGRCYQRRVRLNGHHWEWRRFCD